MSEVSRQSIEVIDQNIPLDDEIHFVMWSLFHEDDVSPTSNSQPINNIGSPFPNLILVLYHSLACFVSYLFKILKF